MGKIKDIIKKLAVSGFLSGSVGTAIAVEKAEEKIKKLIPKKRRPIQEKLTSKFDWLDRNSNLMTAGYNDAIEEINKRLFQ